MKLTFRGWQRETRLHIHPVIPVSSGKTYKPEPKAEAMIWANASTTYGKVTNLGLSGAFLVQVDVEQADMEGWLTQLVKTNPEAAIRLLGKMQAEAVIQLAKNAAGDEEM